MSHLHSPLSCFENFNEPTTYEITYRESSIEHMKLLIDRLSSSGFENVYSIGGI
jgi:hypothetical protein